DGSVLRFNSPALVGGSTGLVQIGLKACVPQTFAKLVISLFVQDRNGQAEIDVDSANVQRPIRRQFRLRNDKAWDKTANDDAFVPQIAQLGGQVETCGANPLDRGGRIAGGNRGFTFHAAPNRGAFCAARRPPLSPALAGPSSLSRLERGLRIGCQLASDSRGILLRHREERARDLPLSVPLRTRFP